MRRAPSGEAEDGIRSLPSRRVDCPDCGAYLADERLLAEFPESRAGHGGERERPLTISELLRATTGPTPPPSAAPGSDAPVRPIEPIRRRGVPDTRGGQGAPSSAAATHEAEWHRSAAPLIPRNFGAAQRRFAMFDVALSTVSLVVIVAVVLSFSLHVALDRGDGAAAGPAPRAAIVPASILRSGSRPALLPPASVPGPDFARLPTIPARAALLGDLLPPSVPGGWTRADNAIDLTGGAGASDHELSSASYRRGEEQVQVWVDRAGDSAEAQIARSHPVAPYVRSWQQGGAAVTIGASSARDGEAFARSYRSL